MNLFRIISAVLFCSIDWAMSFCFYVYLIIICKNVCIWKKQPHLSVSTDYLCEREDQSVQLIILFLNSFSGILFSGNVISQFKRKLSLFLLCEFAISCSLLSFCSNALFGGDARSCCIGLCFQQSPGILSILVLISALSQMRQKLCYC